MSTLEHLSPGRPSAPEAPTLGLHGHAERLRDARRQWITEGQADASLVGPRVTERWARSRALGLLPDSRAVGVPHASTAQLKRALAQRSHMVSHAQPVMAFLSEQIADSDSLVILADPQGMLLQAWGDPGFADRAARVALRPGALWSEQWRGTNAIGTALTEDRAVVVHGGEHYLERNGFLTCTAVPIADPRGPLLGVLDISGTRRSYHPHTLALVRSGARMIEHQLFAARHGREPHLRLHRHREGLCTVTEGLLALSDDGWIIAATRAALDLLGLPREAIGQTPLSRVFADDTTGLWPGGTSLPSPTALPMALRLHNGQTLWARIEQPRRWSAWAPVETVTDLRPRARDALAALDTGDAALHNTLERARRVLDKPIALLLQGDSGVGKEVVARAVHASGPRQHKPFVAVNCAALPDSLIEAELFGHRPGAFTGALREGSPGRIREAEGGVLLLDEIGDTPLAVQARLLRVLQDRQVVPLGGGKPVAVDFQLICATHRRLREEVAAGRFREDLYYRINGLTLSLPALRERSDRLALAEAMLREFAPGRPLRLCPQTADAFYRYRWPGNLRQLASALRTACALIGDDEPCVTLEHLPEDLAEELRPLLTPAEDAGKLAADTAGDLRQHEARRIAEAMAEAQGNVSHAAKALGISRNTLYRKLGRPR